jgi:putative phage-type endonuclease
MLERITTTSVGNNAETQRTNRSDNQVHLRVLTLEQGSPEWLLWRQSGIGSSDAPVIANGVHFGRDRLQLWKEKMGCLKPPSFTPWQNKRMRRGQIMEPDVRSWYRQFTGCEVEPLCCVHTYMDWLKASLDGWVSSSRTILEIKCPNEKDHQTALDQNVPTKYIPQLNHLMLVTGAAHLHYLSYSPDRPRRERFALVSVYPEVHSLRTLLQKEEIFWQCLSEKIPPSDEMFADN